MNTIEMSLHERHKAPHTSHALKINKMLFWSMEWANCGDLFYFQASFLLNKYLWISRKKILVPKYPLPMPIYAYKVAHAHACMRSSI